MKGLCSKRCNSLRSVTAVINALVCFASAGKLCGLRLAGELPANLGRLLASDLTSLSSQSVNSCRVLGKTIGDTVLFFGCRHKAEDYIYEEEIEQYHTEGTISHLFVAFSRDQVGKTL